MFPVESVDGSTLTNKSGASSVAYPFNSTFSFSTSNAADTLLFLSSSSSSSPPSPPSSSTASSFHLCFYRLSDLLLSFYPAFSSHLSSSSSSLQSSALFLSFSHYQRLQSSCLTGYRYQDWDAREETMNIEEALIRSFGVKSSNGTIIGNKTSGRGMGSERKQQQPQQQQQQQQQRTQFKPHQHDRTNTVSSIYTNYSVSRVSSTMSLDVSDFSGVNTTGNNTNRGQRRQQNNIAEGSGKGGRSEFIQRLDHAEEIRLKRAAENPDSVSIVYGVLKEREQGKLERAERVVKRREELLKLVQREAQQEQAAIAIARRTRKE